MAVGRSQILKVAIALVTAVLVTLVLFRALIVPLLPPLEVVVSQLFVRLRDVLAFLAFTTVIAVAIFSSQHRDAQRSNTAKKPFLDHHPFGFGETENSRDIAEEDVLALACGSKQMQMNNSSDAMVDYSMEKRAPAAAMGNGSLLQNRSAKLDTETSPGHEFPTSKEASSSEPEPMSVGHRKSTSSIADSLNHETSPDRTLPRSTSARSKPSKRVSFSHPSPSKDRAGLEGSAKQSREHPHEKQKALAPGGDITMQADAFIAKFKEQMRMQRLESFYRRQGPDQQ